MPETQNSENISTKCQRVAQLAREAPDLAFTSRSHHIDVAWLKEAYRRTRKAGAAGLDGQTAEGYGAHLEENLRDLLDRAKSGRYRAPAVRRVHIPKGDGKETRPIGIPTFEDKVLQRAVVMLLEAVYEQDFLELSYGFRPGRSAHDALEAFWRQAMRLGGGWVLELDIRKFFDSVDRAHLRAILSKRIRDGVLLRLIGKWLNAGVMEDGVLHHTDTGTPQGGVISPLLANIFLHEILDEWFEQTVKPRLQGRAFLVRYADDAVMLFTNERDARRVLEVLPKRFGKYGLRLHPEKTRLVPFEAPDRHAPPEDPPDGGEGPGSFDFLGFTHFWSRSRQGRWVIKRATAKSRFTRALKAIAQWCRNVRHRPLYEQHRMLSLKLKGHYAYFGITANSKALSRFRYEVAKTWHKWVSRRSPRREAANWAWFGKILERFPLPPARLTHAVLPLGASP